MNYVGDAVATLQERISLQAQANAALRLELEQLARAAVECTELHNSFQSLTEPLTACWTAASDLLQCYWSGAHSSCAALDGQHYPALWTSCWRFAQCTLSLGRSFECSHPSSPWVGLLMFVVVAFIAFRLVWYCATTCSVLYRLLTARASLQKAMPTGVRLDRRQNRVRGQRKFWVVIKAGIAVALWLAYMMFALSATSFMSWVTDQLKVNDSNGQSPQGDTHLERVWGLLTRAPALLIGERSLDRVIVLYTLTAVVLPLFLMISKGMRSAAEDAEGIVQPVPESSSTPLGTSPAMPQHPLIEGTIA